MTPARRTFLAAGLLSFVAGMILLFPARVAYQWMVPDTVRLAGIDGTVWSGSAREMSVGGVYFHDTRWRMHPLRLVSGKLALGIEARLASGFIEADVALGIGGVISITGLNGAIPLRALATLLRMPELAGKASLQFNRIVLQNGLPVHVEGRLGVADLVAPLVDASSIGGYEAEFLTNDTGVVASVEDVNGVYDLAGTLTISADRNYEFLGRIAATERTSDKLRRQLRILGTPDGRGQRELRLEGTL